MKIKYVPDSRIIELATRNGKLGLLTTWKDLSLTGGLTINNIRPIVGGVYDRQIFGSLDSKSNRAQDFSRYGCIKLPIKYCADIRKKQLIELIKSTKLFMIEVYENDEYQGNAPFLGKDNLKQIPDQLDWIQFNVDAEARRIVASPNVTDSTRCSYEGIIQGLIDLGESELADKVDKLFTNEYVLVLPLSCRKFSVRVIDGVATPNNDKLTQYYRYLLYGIEYYSNLVSDPKYSDDTEEANANLDLLNYKLRRLAASIGGSSDLFKGGKANFSRRMQKSRLNGSARAVIIPDPSIQIDEVGIPLHLAYDMCDKEFIEYLMINFGLSKVQALAKFKKPYAGNTLEIFSHFIDGKKPKVDEDGQLPERFGDIEWVEDEMGPQYCIINRQPSLHQLSLLSCRVKLTMDNAIKYPIALCAPLNADFDGDTIAVHQVPKSMSDTINRYMNPKNLVYWTKNSKPLFTPNHDELLGHIIMTKVPTEDKVTDCADIESAKDRLLKEFTKKPSERELNFNSRVQFGDNLNTTTIGRAILSTIYDNDPYYIENVLLGESRKRSEDKGIDVVVNQLDSDIVADLILHLTQFMQDKEHEGATREHRMRDMQYWTLMAATKSGSTAPRLSQLYIGVSEEMLKRIEEVENDETLDQSTKSIKAASIYSEYVDKKSAKGLPEEVVKQVKESSRAKESQLVAMTNAHLVVDPNQVTHVTRSTYVQGMSYDDYINVTTSNRGIQAIKHSATPESGYLTRQLLYACDNWVLNAVLKDEDNSGLLLPNKLAIGRTLMDGSIYNGGPEKYVRVRSVVTSSKPRFVVTPDMLNAKYHSHLGDNYQIGASFATSLTEGITQSALGLKHGGTLQDYDHGDLPARPSIKDLERIKDHGTFLYAPDDCTLEVQDLFIMLKSRNRVYKYPKPQNVSFLSMDQNFKKGELICIIPEQFTPGMKCDSILKFIGASGTRIPLKYLRNSVVVSDCYCIKEGTIKYGIETVHHQGTSYEVPTVMIGGVKYKYNPNCSYQIPDGDVVKVGQRICSGICSMGYVFNHYGADVDQDVAYSIFYDQITKLNPGISTELLELVYAVIFTDYDEKTKKHTSVNRSLAKVLESDAGTYQMIANKSPKAKFEKIDPEQGEEFVVDEMSTRMLMTLINNLNQ